MDPISVESEKKIERFDYNLNEIAYLRTISVTHNSYFKQLVLLNLRHCSLR